ncbi:MAG: hypothetical protein R3E13_05185 [Alphaproteobacteria bacterium]
MADAPATLDNLNKLITDLLEKDPENGPAILERIFSSDTPETQFALSQIAAQLGNNSPFSNAFTKYRDGAPDGAEETAKHRHIIEQIQFIIMQEAAMNFLATQQEWINQQFERYHNAQTAEEKAAILKHMEDTLTQQLREKFPDLSDEQIKEIVQTKLKEDLTQYLIDKEGLDRELAEKKAEELSKDPENIHMQTHVMSLNASLEEMKTAQADLENTQHMIDELEKAIGHLESQDNEMADASAEYYKNLLIEQEAKIETLKAEIEEQQTAIKNEINQLDEGIQGYFISQLSESAKLARDLNLDSPLTYTFQAAGGWGSNSENAFLHSISQPIDGVDLNAEEMSDAEIMGIKPVTFGTAPYARSEDSGETSRRFKAAAENSPADTTTLIANTTPDPAIKTGMNT